MVNVGLPDAGLVGFIWSVCPVVWKIRSVLKSEEETLDLELLVNLHFRIVEL